jgi:DNA-binding NarL/FixJ family response regulator
MMVSAGLEPLVAEHGDAIEPVKKPSRGRSKRTAVAPRNGRATYSISRLTTVVDMVEIELRVESLRRTVALARDELDRVRRDLEALTHAVPEAQRVERGRALLATLTRQERRIALLAADGLSNSQVAADINITAETVRGHMKGVFRKLGIHSRWELTYLLSPDG